MPKSRPGRYLVAVTYKAERAMKFLLRVAVELLQSLIDDKPYPLEEAWRLVAAETESDSVRQLVI